MNNNFIQRTFTWSRAFMPVVAFLAAIASAIRTAMSVSEIYSGSGSPLLPTLIAMLAFAVAGDGALFIFGMAQEAHRLKRIAEGRPRRVTSLLGILRALAVRIGIKQPLPYSELEQDSMTPVIVTAFVFVLSSNFYIGFRPMIAQIGAQSLQDFILAIPSANAQLQLTFVVDLAAILFPPLMALAAGHQTARFAAESLSTYQQEDQLIDDNPFHLNARRNGHGSPSERAGLPTAPIVESE